MVWCIIDPLLGILSSLSLLPSFHVTATSLPRPAESYNYWEPTHWLLYGTGMQTWEYSPLYALRSYLYLWLYAGPMTMMQWLGVESALGKPALFFGMRLVIGTTSAMCEARFARAASRRFGWVHQFVLSVVA